MTRHPPQFNATSHSFPTPRSTDLKAPLLDDQTIKRRMPPCALVYQPDQRPPARRLLRILVPDRHRLPRADIDVVEVIAARRIEFPELRQRLSRAQSLGRTQRHERDAKGLQNLATCNRKARRLCFRKRSEEHKSELQSLIRTSYAFYCLNKQK